MGCAVQTTRSNGGIKGIRCFSSSCFSKINLLIKSSRSWLCSSAISIDANAWRSQYSVYVNRMEKPFTMIWGISTTFTVRCGLDMMLYPFDTHECYLEVGPFVRTMYSEQMYTSPENCTFDGDYGRDQTSEFSFKVKNCVSIL